MENNSGHDTARVVPTRRRWTDSEKRDIVEESMAPSNSVPAVASKHGVSASQVYRWVRQYQRGAAAESSGAALVPVKVTGTNDRVRVERNPRTTAGERLGSLQLDVGNARLAVHGAADLCSLRLVLEYLLR